MYEIVLAHRAPTGVNRHDFQSGWQDERTRLIEEDQDDLGCVGYRQTHQLAPTDLVYQGLRTTRSWPVTASISLLNGEQIEPWWGDGRSLLPEQPWDVIESMAFASLDDLTTLLQDGDSKKALERFAGYHDQRAGETDVLVVESTVTAPDQRAGSPELSVAFFLRRDSGLSRAEMHSYWRSDHANLVVTLKHALGYRTYEQLYVQSRPEFAGLIDRLGGEPSIPFDAVARLTYSSRATLGSGFLNPRTLIANTRLVGDEVTFADLQRSVLTVGRTNEWLTDQSVHDGAKA